MDCKVEKMPAFRVIGFFKHIPVNEGFTQCPKFWDRVENKYFSRLDDGSDISKAVLANKVGELAVCLHEPDDKEFFGYMIAGFYKNGELPVGMTAYEFKASKWAKFRCVGAMPDAIQRLSERIWQEWIPNSTYYEPLNDNCIEWYSDGDTTADDYIAEVWIPVRDKPLTK